MKIAVLVYGRLNKCAEHYESIMNSIGKENHIDFFLSSDNSSKELLEVFISIYKPISYINDPIKYTCDFGKYPRRPETNIDTMTRHFINKSRVFSLLEGHLASGIKYDVILSLRVDLIYERKLCFTHIDTYTIYIPEGYDYTINACNDRLAYGNIDVMKIYHSIYENTPELLEKGLSISHPESLTFNNLIYNYISISRFPFTCEINR